MVVNTIPHWEAAQLYSTSTGHKELSLVLPAPPEICGLDPLRVDEKLVVAPLRTNLYHLPVEANPALSLISFGPAWMG